MARKNDRLIGRSFGNYKVLRKLGAGGMGAVYRAEHVSLGKPAAIKVLLPNIADEEGISRFKREAMIAANLEHPNIVPIYDFGEDQGVFYLVMRLIEGESLSDRLVRQTRLAEEEVIRVIYEVGKGLGHAHAKGLIHRDIKPANILLSHRDEVLIADFGLAKDTGGAGGGLTATGIIMGTPEYMSPEQCEGLPDIDARSDLYSLGLVFYASLTGSVPIAGKTPLQMIHHRTSKDIPPIRSARPDLDEDLAALIMDMLVRDRSQRRLTAEQLLDRLEALRDFPTMVNRGTLRTPGGAAVEATIVEPPSSKLIKARPVSRIVHNTPPSEAPTFEIVHDDRPAPAPMVTATPKAKPRPQPRPKPRPRPQGGPPPGPPGLKEQPGAPPPPQKTNWVLVVFAVIGALSVLCCILMAVAASLGNA